MPFTDSINLVKISMPENIKIPDNNSSTTVVSVDISLSDK